MSVGQSHCTHIAASAAQSPAGHSCSDPERMRSHPARLDPFPSDSARSVPMTAHPDSAATRQPMPHRRCTSGPSSLLGGVPRRADVEPGVLSHRDRRCGAAPPGVDADHDPCVCSLLHARFPQGSVGHVSATPLDAASYPPTPVVAEGAAPVVGGRRLLLCRCQVPASGHSVPVLALLLQRIAYIR